MTAGQGPGSDLAGRRIIVVEDEALIAMMLEDMLTDFGCEVVGVAGSLPEALRLVDKPIDCAVLDVNLGGTPIDPVMQRLADRGVPFVFLSGYDAADLPPHLSTAPLVRKPLKAETLRAAIADQLAA